MRVDVHDVPPDPSVRMEWLDALRGIAVLAVVCFHLSPSFLGADVHATVLRHFDVGKYGVVLFFLVSGYVIPMSLERHGSLPRFWAGRLFRLYPAYLLAIGMMLLVTRRWHGGLDSALGHVTMLLDPLGIAGAVRVFWTLSYEMVFYLLVSALFAWDLHRRSEWWASLLACSAFVLKPILPDGLVASTFTGRRLTAIAVLILLVFILCAYFRGSRTAVLAAAAARRLARITADGCPPASGPRPDRSPSSRFVGVLPARRGSGTTPRPGRLHPVRLGDAERRNGASAAFGQRHAKLTAHLTPRVPGGRINGSFGRSACGV